jgi:NADH-quinone oxidoreductase subunit E
MPVEEEKIRAIASRFPKGDASQLRAFLSVVQGELNWIPPEALEEACEHLGVSYPRAYEEASLNPEFSMERRGRNVVAVCRGLACNEAHSADVLKDWEKSLALKAGENSVDGGFTLLNHYCFGRCAIGPNIRVNGTLYSGQVPGVAAKFLAEGSFNS